MPRAREPSNEEDSVRFPDLVRAREAQQEKLRAALLNQNLDLQRRLEAASPGRDDSEPGQESVLQLSPGQSAVNSPPPTRSGSEPTADRPPLAPGTGGGGAVLTSTARDDLLASVRKIVVEEQESQMKAIQTHTAAVDERLGKMESAIDEIRGTLEKKDATWAILRDEHMQQHLELCGEMDKLREELATSVEQRREDARAMTRDVVQRLEDAVEESNRRVQALIDLPSTVRADLEALDDRFSALSAGINAERQSLTTQRGEIQARQEAELADVLREAKERVTGFSAAAVECQQKTENAAASVTDTINEAVGRVAEQLESEIMSRLEDQTERVNQATQRQAMEHQNMQQEIQTALAEARTSVESSLMGMRRQYHDAVQEQLRAVVQQAEEFEEQRRAECPVADSDRVDLMVQELQGASTMLEGLMQTLAAAQRPDANAPARMDALEVKLAGLEGRLDQMNAHTAAEGDESASAGPLRISISVPVQTDAMDNTVFKQPSAKEQVAERAQRHLADELDRAADEVRLASARKALAKGSSPRAGQAPRAPNTARTAVDGYPVPPSSASHADPSPAPVAPQPQPQPERDPHTLNDAELQERLGTKTMMLQRIQELLRSIQATFHSLTEQEDAQGHLWPREKVEEVTRQKQEMYARERQLLEQRNALWQAVLELKEIQEQRQLTN